MTYKTSSCGCKLKPGGLLGPYVDRSECTNAQLQQQVWEPIPMILFCPKCGMQHIDAPDEQTPDWNNPPHRTHLCRNCKHRWRPCDRATDGVRELKTVGKDDSPKAEPREQITSLEAQLAFEKARDLRLQESVIAAWRERIRDLEEALRSLPDTQDYRDAVAGKDATKFLSLGYEWSDKPHRLVYDLCKAIDAAKSVLSPKEPTVQTATHDWDCRSTQMGDLCDCTKTGKQWQTATPE